MVLQMTEMSYLSQRVISREPGFELRMYTVFEKQRFTSSKLVASAISKMYSELHIMVGVFINQKKAKLRLVMSGLDSIRQYSTQQ